MAKVPGPAIAMAGIAAIFLLSRGGSDDAVVVPDSEWEPPDPGDDGTTTTTAGSTKPKTSGTGGGTSSNPPNLSGDPAGYNSELFSEPSKVREMLAWLGYGIAVNSKSVIKNSSAIKFQTDYNRASADGTFAAQGRLLVDGTMGKYSLRALGIIVTGGWEQPLMSTPLDQSVPAAWAQAMMAQGA